MSGIFKIAAKVGAVALMAFGVGYAEYRIKGGRPLHQLYGEIRKEQLQEAAIEAAKAKAKPIKVDGTVK